MIVISSTDLPFVDVNQDVWGTLRCDGCNRLMGYENLGKVQNVVNLHLPMPHAVKCRTCKSLEEIDARWTLDRSNQIT